jgi:hypothetical protein
MTPAQLYILADVPTTPAETSEMTPTGDGQDLLALAHLQPKASNG